MQAQVGSRKTRRVHMLRVEVFLTAQILPSRIVIEMWYWLL